MTKEEICALLEKYGIAKVTVEYSGSGDSGNLRDIEAWSDEAVPGSPGTATLKSVTPELGIALEDYLWNVCDGANPGWEIDDGGRGTITIYVKDRRVLIEHIVYYLKEMVKDPMWWNDEGEEDGPEEVRVSTVELQATDWAEGQKAASPPPPEPPDPNGPREIRMPRLTRNQE